MRTFLKQYGARRTGTNYLRSLIRMHYRDVVPLMHILGDKHSPPAPFETLWRDAQSEADPALAFATNASTYAPAESTHLDRAEQRHELERLAAPIGRAYASGALAFVISVKDPYAWISSIARYRMWIPWHDRTSVLGPELVDRITAACAEFNMVYASWLALPRAHVVRYEELLADPDATLLRLESSLGLERHAPFRNVTSESFALDWDHSRERRSASPFDRAYYVEKKYLRRLSPAVRDAVTKTIDWPSIGYEPVGESWM
jgi:hypothetical protein